MLIVHFFFNVFTINIQPTLAAFVQFGVSIVRKLNNVHTYRMAVISSNSKSPIV